MEICGKRVVLRPTRADDYGFLKSIWNDGRVMKWVGFPDGVGYTDDSLKRRFENRTKDPNFHHFIVWDKNGDACGEVHYDYVSSKRRAGLDVKIIPEVQGRGYATEALTLVIDSAFNAETDLDEVYTEPIPENEAAQKLYARCGLRPKQRPPDLGQGKSYWSLERNRWLKQRGSRERKSVV